jgi:hypothetical protein
VIHTFAVSCADRPHLSEPYAIVVELLQKIGNSTTLTPAITRGNSEQPRHTVELTGSSNSNNTNMSFEIIPPKIENAEQYEYLPGHFTAHRVLGMDTTSDEQRLIVRMKSGELLTVSINQSCLYQID